MGWIKITLHDEHHAAFRVYGLDKEDFEAYRLAMDGATYVRTIDPPANIASLDRVPAILRRLRKARLPLGRDDMDPRLRRILQERSTAQDWLDHDGTKHRIALIKARLAARGERLLDHQPAAILWLARKHGGLLADDQGLGKAQPVDEPVLTPSGWRPIGQLQPGDRVIGSNGRSTRVVEVFPQGRREIFRITLDDGSTVRADGEHLWHVQTPNTRRRGDRPRVMTTKELLAARLHYGAPYRCHSWFLPIVAPVRFRARRFALDPYLVGALLANGALKYGTSPCVDFGGFDQVYQVRRVLPRGVGLVRHARSTAGGGMRFAFSGGQRGIKDSNLIGVTVRVLGMKVGAKEKRVPPRYLLGSIGQRLALLQGLMDHDGTVSKDGMTAEYNTISPGLASDVVALVRSLGGVAWMTTRVPHYTYRGERRAGQIDHRVRMSLPAATIPFRLPRKRKRLTPRSKYQPTHAIERIEPCGSSECVCIRVEAEDHLYVTNDYVLTHNSIECLIAMPASAAAIIVCPAAMKGDWVGFVQRWRPDLTPIVLRGRSSFRWPQPGQVLITNYDVLPDVHDRDGLSGRACVGFLPPRDCPGCKDKITFTGNAIVTTRTAHSDDCVGKLKQDLDHPRPCAGCHPLLALAPRRMVLVFDEAQDLKNETTNRHKRACAIADVVRRKDGYVWPMSGTPLENSPSELWAVLRAGTIHEEAFGSRERFQALFRARERAGGSIAWGMPSEEVSSCLRRIMYRRLKKDVLDLPAKLRRRNYVDLDKVTYKRIDDALAATGRSVRDIIELIAKEEVPFTIMSSVRAALAAAKVPRMLEVVAHYEMQNLPLVVFSDHRFPVETLGARPGWVMIIGGDGDNVTRVKDEFQNGFLAGPSDRFVVDKAGIRRRCDSADGIIYPRGIAITIKAGGRGLTLTRAGHILFVDRAWNAQVNVQAEDRCHRIGAEIHGSIDIMDIVSNHPLDLRVLEVIEQKVKLFDASINAAAERDIGSAEEAALAREMREEAEAIASGLAVRRGARNSRERGAWEALHTLVFDSPYDEQIAADLAEQSDTIGLSDKQWSLAVVITRKGRRPDEPPARPTPEPEPELVHVPSEDDDRPPPPPPSLPPPPPPVPTKPEPNRALSPLERRRLAWDRR